MNPRSRNGEIIRCPSCDSIRHMLADCPDSYENLHKFKSMAMAAAESEARGGGKEEEKKVYEEVLVTLQTGKRGLVGLESETLGCLLLDTRCSRNVMGETWWRNYKASLPHGMKEKITERPSDGRKFRFSGDEWLSSLMLVRFPAIIAERLVNIESHVVKKNIPLLWSCPSQEKAGTVLNIPQGRVKVFGQWVEMKMTSSGHCLLPILPMMKPENRKEKNRELLATIHNRPGRENYPTSWTEVTQYSPKLTAAVDRGEGVKGVEHEGREGAGGDADQGDGGVDQGDGGDADQSDGGVEREAIVAGRTKYPRAGESIQFKEGDIWQSAQVISRGGKASSKVNAGYFNVKVNGEPSGIYLDRVEWKKADVVDKAPGEEGALVSMVKAPGSREAKGRKVEALDSTLQLDN